MCGLAGIMAGSRVPPPDLEELKRMIAMVSHRGPDGYGFLCDGLIGLAHARLSIVGLHDGFQPIHDGERKLWISYNGEIFNHLELRAELSAMGFRFRTSTDTEVIVHGFRAWGSALWTRLNGQFAFALWDGRAGDLWLVRDRLGILPLFYAHTGEHVVFASEIKAIFAGGRVSPRFNPGHLAQSFSHWSVTPHGSVFAGIEAVPPGTALRIDRNLNCRANRYWQPDFSIDPSLADQPIGHIADRLEQALTDSVRLRLRADVPVGVYISGGLDSSVLAAIARKLDTTQMHSFGIRFADDDFDETVQQRLVANHVGTRHHDILVTADDIHDSLEDTIWHAEAPLLRTAPVPLYLLSRLVRDTGIRVVLSGEGADEWLGGYDIFKEDKVRRFWARQPSSTMRPALLGRIHPFAAAGHKAGPLWQAFWKRGMEEGADPFYAHRPRWRNTAWSRILLAPDIRNSFQEADGDQALIRDMPTDWGEWSNLGRAQWAEITAFMTPYLLASQGDRVAMAHSVEVRYPYLDPDFNTLCSQLPDRARMLGLRDKPALRRVAARLLPDEIFQRPKRPYRAPMTIALFGGRNSRVVEEHLSDTALGRYGLVDVKPATSLINKARINQGHMTGEREEMALLGLVTLQMLAKAMLDDFPALAAKARYELDRAPIHILEDIRQTPSPEPVSATLT